jgi:hypothetical protein
LFYKMFLFCYIQAKYPFNLGVLAESIEN